MGKRNGGRSDRVSISSLGDTPRHMHATKTLRWRSICVHSIFFFFFNPSTQRIVVIAGQIRKPAYPPWPQIGHDVCLP